MDIAPDFYLGKDVGGRYRIMGHLGGGGFGQTYLAEDQHLPFNPRCVVKLLKPKLGDALNLITAKRLFETEARVLYRLSDCDRIPRLLAHFEEGEDFYLVQEFIPGENLSGEFQSGRCFSEVHVVSLLRDILEILVFVHGHQVIHRDIKPSNLIRRNRDNKIVLIDFGAVKQLGSPLVLPKGHTTWTIAIGSPGYMPNEQLAGKPRFCSDLYAVGMIGIQALTGLHPKEFPEDASGEVMWRDRSAVNPLLADILDKLVRYDFRQRYHTAPDVLSDLSKLTALYPSLDEPLDAIAPAASQDLFVTTAPLSQLFVNSDHGSDYHHLQDLLSARNWQEANQVTQSLMVKVCTEARAMPQVPNDAAPLPAKSIQAFPCRDLCVLDYLWLHYSDRHFGFSVQKRIWQDVGGSAETSSENLAMLTQAKRLGWRVNGPMERFGHRVGWRVKERWIASSHVLFDLDAPEGHLPAWSPGPIAPGEAMAAFFSRLVACLP